MKKSSMAACGLALGAAALMTSDFARAAEFTDNGHMIARSGTVPHVSTTTGKIVYPEGGIVLEHLVASGKGGLLRIWDFAAMQVCLARPESEHSVLPGNGIGCTAIDSRNNSEASTRLEELNKIRAIHNMEPVSPQ